ncbi:MAG: transposase [Chloracidobacterium sp.]|nr:transposase [Chloracidobacterium sp.]
MARRPRVEIEGGLYHVIVRGNDRQDIFHSREDQMKFISLIEKAKQNLGFYVYAYCLMTNHLHLLIERRSETVGRIIKQVLTGYSQYYNKRYHKVGHLFQGRHKSILCQSDPYLAKLVRYIHLNPVRAKWSQRPTSTNSAATGRILASNLMASSMSIRCCGVSARISERPTNATLHLWQPP